MGESHIKARLARFSTVTKFDTDSGIDFYCELIEDNEPSLPFYVQAKGTGHFDQRWGASVPKSTVLYWLKQHSPVFLIVYSEQDDECYWESIEQMRYQLHERLVDEDRESIYIKVDRTNTIDALGARASDLVDAVKSDHVFTELARGKAAFRGDGYVKKTPHLPRTKTERAQVAANVRSGLYSLTQDALSRDDFDSARQYCDFLATWDASHYNHFVWQAQVRQHDGDFTGARDSLREALAICDRDKQWPADSMRMIKTWLQSEIDRLTSMQ